MSKRPDNDSTLPSPRSPQHLDDQILAHARAKAPNQRSHWRPLWGGGLATAAVLVVAVYLTQLTGQEQKGPMVEEMTAPAETRMQAPTAASTKRELARPEQAADYAGEMETEPVQEGSVMAAMADSDTGKAQSRAGKLGDGAPADVDRALQQLRELVARGELELAQEKYAQLRASCSDCELPATLDEALAP